MSEKLKVTTKGEQKAREKKPPMIDARKAGRIGQMMESLALQYRRAYPEREVRWVYSPLHRSELSNVMSRRAQGYRPVLASEIDTPDGFNGDDQIRVGDCILMSVEVEIRRELEAEVKERADGQLQQVESEYYESLEQLDKREGRSPRMKPAGRAVIEERDREYEHKQRED